MSESEVNERETFTHFLGKYRTKKITNQKTFVNATHRNVSNCYFRIRFLSKRITTNRLQWVK
jgi:hypothetical protein